MGSLPKVTSLSRLLLGNHTTTHPHLSFQRPYTAFPSLNKWKSPPYRDEQQILTQNGEKFKKLNSLAAEGAAEFARKQALECNTIMKTEKVINSNKLITTKRPFSQQLKSTTYKDEKNIVNENNEQLSLLVVAKETSPLMNRKKQTLETNTIINNKNNMKSTNLVTTNITETQLKRKVNDVNVKLNLLPCSTSLLISVQKLSGLFSSGKSIPWHSVVSTSRLNLQQVRFHNTSSTGGPDRIANTDQCIPRKAKYQGPPLPCVINRAKAKRCVTATQKLWPNPEKDMCLPCCRKVSKPLRCYNFVIKYNDCPRKRYRIASYSECNKRYGRPEYKKECCYVKRICFMRNITDREILPLIPIKDRQAKVLGMNLKPTPEPWGS